MAIALLVAGASRAAPLPPFAPVDICGEIRSYAWSPPASVAAIPGASGTLGKERHFPARFRIELGGYTGIEDATAVLINRLLGRPEDGAPRPARLLLLLPADDPALLAGARSLCVRGFRIWGDEGGTWTGYEALDLGAGGGR
ncbi:MAG: hypothetical protein U1E53_07960 [Dongiaceae bacterium]